MNTKVVKIFMSCFGFHQILNEPTHILNSSSCIDSIFTSQLSRATEYGAYSSLHSNFYQKIAYVKFNSDVIYMPSHERS